MRSYATVVVGVALAAGGTGCGDACGGNTKEIANELTEAGVVMEGAVGCGFGSAERDEVMVSIAYSKVAHSGNFKRVGLDYVKHLEDAGWERVACAGGLGSTGMTEFDFTECNKKGDKRVRIRTYNKSTGIPLVEATLVDIDLLRLMTKEEVLADVPGGQDD